jgi:uncharacterized phiE125 gp8 family phage protein
MGYSVQDLTTTTPASVISTADLKAFLRVEHSEEDTLIEAMRVAAIQHIENMCNIGIGDRNAYVTFDVVPKELEIPVGPVSQISAVTVGTSSGQSLIATTSYYTDLQRKPARLTFIDVPSAYEHTYEKIQVLCNYGYNEASVPEALVHAIKLLVAHMYELRQPEVIGTISTSLKLGLESLVNPYRIVSFR